MCLPMSFWLQHWTVQSMLNKNLNLNKFINQNVWILNRIPAHRLVLSAASLFFENLFTIDMKEKNLKEIPLGGVSGAILGQLIDFCYTHQITVDMSNVEDLLAAASLFQIVDLVDVCERTFLKAMDTTNVFKILAFAHQYELNALKQTARTFTLDHFPMIVENEEFRQLEVESVAKYLGNDEIFIDSEEDIFDAIVKWVEHDLKVRKAHYAILLTTIRFSKIKNDVRPFRV